VFAYIWLLYKPCDGYVHGVVSYAHGEIGYALVGKLIIQYHIWVW